MNTVNNKEDDNASVCANCGKEGSDISNTCNKCKQVKYCNAACKKKHRHKHNQDCKKHVRLAVEQAAKLHDEKLFRQPPTEDCPICFLRNPILDTGIEGYRYQTCCGKVICSGCTFAPVYDDQGNVIAEEKCPFCRTPYPKSDEELIKMEMKGKQGMYYRDGIHGFPQDHSKALEHWQSCRTWLCESLYLYWFCLLQG